MSGFLTYAHLVLNMRKHLCHGGGYYDKKLN